MSIIVHTVPLSAKKFTLDDLDISKKYINPEVYPGLYSKDVLPKGVEFIDRRLMNISDISMGVEENVDIKPEMLKMNLVQGFLARAYGRGANADDVHAQIEVFGYKLSSIPISVGRGPNNKDTIINGRTRLEKLIAAGFTNVIVDYYTCTDWDCFGKMVVMTNGVQDPYSPHTKADIIVHCNQAINNGSLRKEYNDILARVKEIAPSSFKQATVNKIVLNVLEGNNHTSAVLAFTETSAKEWLKTFGYHDNVNGNGIYYKVISTQFHSKAITMAAKYLQRDLAGCDVKELRVILHTDTLDGADPERSWKSKIDTFRSKWDNALDDITKSFFITTKPKTTVKLYGVIPAVQLLQEIYPMDKLVMFHVGKLKDMSFSEIDSDTGLNNFFQQAA